MSGADSGHDPSEPCLVEDPDTGDRYLMYPLRISAWPGAPRIVYECPTCQGRWPAADWSHGCPGCHGGKGKRKKRRKDR